MATYRVEFDYAAQLAARGGRGAGQVPMDSPALSIGDRVDFVILNVPSPLPDVAGHGSFMVTQPQRPGAEATMTGEFQGSRKSDRQSFSWSFNHHLPKSGEVISVTISDSDTPGIRGYLTAIGDKKRK